MTEVPQFDVELNVDLDREAAIAILSKWLSGTPVYGGDDPRARHYQATRKALKTAIAALSAAPAAAQDVVERVALAILNSDRLAAGWPAVTSRDDIPDSDGYVRNARAAIAAMPREQQWQPIETAPKDGRLVDLWWDGVRFVDCFWMNESPDFPSRQVGWICQLGATFHLSDIRAAPTHWFEYSAPLDAHAKGGE